MAPVDFSETAGKALRYASAMAREFNAELVLVHVIAPYPTVPDVPAITPDLQSVLIDDATAQMKKVQDSIKGIPTRPIILSGHPARSIVAQAVAEEIDLIITATHGRTGLAHVFLGSVAEQIVRLAPCPVLVVREHEHEFLVTEKDEAGKN